MCWQHADITQMSGASAFSAWWILIRHTHTHTVFTLAPGLSTAHFIPLSLCLCLFLSPCVVSSLSSDLDRKLTDSAGSRRTKPLPLRPTREDLSLQLPTGNPYTLVDIKEIFLQIYGRVFAVCNSIPAKLSILFSQKISQDEGEAKNYSRSASI